jgi:hypothetical protein
VVAVQNPVFLDKHSEPSWRGTGRGLPGPVPR